MAMAMEMTSASAQALLAVSAHRRLVSLRHCTVALPPLRSHAPALPRRLVVVRATSQVDTGSTASPKATVPDTEVSITKTSFGTIGLIVGTALLSYGFGAYFTFFPGSEWSAIMLTYGFPLSVIGFALKYAELKPVPCVTYEDAFKLREAQATEILATRRPKFQSFFGPGVVAEIAVAGTAAVVGTLGHAPWQSAVALRLSSSRAFVPAQFGAQRFRFRGRLHLQSCHYRRSGRSVFVAQNSAQTEAKGTEEDEEVKQETEEDVSNGATEAPAAEESLPSSIQDLLWGYKDALASNDEGAVSEYEKELESIANERDSLRQKVNALIEEISTGKDRYLRLNADFDNYRKRAERDRLATAGNVKGEVIESLLPMVDNFERAKTSIKTETEGEVKIDNSYQGIYKQFVEIMKSLGVVAVETVGKNFDPNLHEAIMREDSTEFAEDVISQEFRRGFRLGDRLLRPAMVKVSSGPGPDSNASDLPVDESLANE